MVLLSRGNTCITPIYDSNPIDKHTTTEEAATQYLHAWFITA